MYPRGLIKHFPDARVGTEFLSHVSAFILPEHLKIHLDDYILSHAKMKNIMSYDEFANYTDYKGTVIEYAGTMEKRFDFFLSNYDGVDVLIRIMTNNNEEEYKEMFFEIAKTLRVIEDKFSTVETVQKLFAEDYTGQKTIEIGRSETHEATFVPFANRNYGLFLPSFYRKMKFEETIHVGFDNENKVYFRDVDSLDLRDVYQSKELSMPVVFDHSLMKYEDYLGSFIDSLLDRYDIFLYKNGEKGAIVTLNYKESENKDIQYFISLFSLSL